MFDTFNNRVVINIKNTAPYYTYLQIYRFNFIGKLRNPIVIIIILIFWKAC